MSFSTGKEMESKFIEYLINNKYPRESILVEYNIGNGCRIDIAVIDPIKNIPIQLFELKNSKNEKNIIIGKEQLQKYRSLIKNKNVPAYLVFPNDIEPYFGIISIDTNDLKEDRNIIEYQNPKVILNYAAQLNARINENVDLIKNEEKTVIDKFKIGSWIIGALTLIIGILSKVGLFTLDAKDLSIMGIAIALFLIPYAGKLKILGVEFERLKNDKSDKNEK